MTGKEVHPMKFTKMGAGTLHRSGQPVRRNTRERIFSACRLSAAAAAPRIGADGLMIVLPAQGIGDYAMRFYNSDGSLGEMCGNGARCIARYGYERGLAGDIQRIETTAGIVVGQRIEEDLYCVRLNDPTAVETEIGIPWDGQILSVSYMELGDPGIPHAVLELPEWDTMPEDELRSLGAYIRSYAAFPKGANGAFRKRLGRDHVKAITYERGVEDFTLACGTGVELPSLPRLRGEIRDETLRLDFPGGELQVSSLSVEEDAVCDIYLTGPTIVVAEGEYLGSVNS